MKSTYESDQVGNILEYIKAHFSEYPLNEAVDRTFFKILEEDFPSFDLLEEFKTFHAWIMDTQIPPNLRSRFRKWIKNADKWASI